MQSLFRRKTEQLSKAISKVIPSSLTGYLAPLANWLKEKEDAPIINMNGMVAEDSQLYSNLQNGVVMKVKDPKGGKSAHTILNPRLAQHLISGDSGKINVLGSESENLTLLDTIQSGSKFDSPIVVSTLRFAAVNSSTTLTKKEISSVPQQIGPPQPTDSTTTPGTIEEILAYFLSPILPGTVYNIVKGKLISQPDSSANNFAGTNAKTGTVNQGENFMNLKIGGSNGR